MCERSQSGAKAIYIYELICFQHQRKDRTKGKAFDIIIFYVLPGKCLENV